MGSTIADGNEAVGYGANKHLREQLRYKKQRVVVLPVLHCLRKSAARTLADAGRIEREIMSTTGHTTSRMVTQRPPIN